MYNYNMNIFKTKDCKNCELAKQTYLEFVSNLSNTNEKYASLVLSVGYVSYISLLAASFSQLYEIGKWFWFACIVLIAISLGLFVGYEIWKIKKFHLYQKELQSKIYNVMINKNFDFTKLLAEIETTKYNKLNDIATATKWIFNISFLSAFLSGISFFICLGLAFSKI